MGRDTETGEHMRTHTYKFIISSGKKNFFNCQEKEIWVHYVAQL